MIGKFPGSSMHENAVDHGKNCGWVTLDKKKKSVGDVNSSV